MHKYINNILAQENDNKFEEDLFVKNIYVKKDKFTAPRLPYIATERWLEQLGNRLKTN
tara:strand:- start:382 stop:555 length:174 start_codon:yes stop_codon:yes gene_type:complete